MELPLVSRLELLSLTDPVAKLPGKFADKAKGLLGLTNPSAFNEDEINVAYKFKAASGVKVDFEFDKTDGGIAFTNTSEYTTAGGVTLSEKFQSSNDITLTAKSKKLVKGLSLTAEAKFKTAGDVCGQVVKGDYALGGNAIMDFKYDTKKDALTTAVATAYEKWLAGVSVTKGGLGGGKDKLDYTVAFSYSDSDMVVTSQITNGSNVEASLYHVSSPTLKAGLVWSHGLADGASTITCGVENKLGDDASIKAKLASGKGNALSVVYSQDLRKGVSIDLKTKVDVNALSGGAHAFGFGVTFEG